MKKSNYLILLILGLMFLAPGVAAYLFYQHPNWLGSSRVNKGILLNPPLHLTSLGHESKWKILFWSPGSCDAVCLQQLDTLARVRLALGRQFYNVELWLLPGDTALPLNKKTRSLLKNYYFQTGTLSALETQKLAALPSKSQVFIANPGNYLVLAYPKNVNPDDVYKDLKLLSAINKSD